MALTLGLILLAAGVGAPLRYVVDQAIQHRWPAAFPVGTFAAGLGPALLRRRPRGPARRRISRPALPAGRRRRG
jgi:hypothetical protein